MKNVFWTNQKQPFIPWDTCRVSPISISFALDQWKNSGLTEKKALRGCVILSTFWGNLVDNLLCLCKVAMLVLMVTFFSPRKNSKYSGHGIWITRKINMWLPKAAQSWFYRRSNVLNLFLDLPLLYLICFCPSWLDLDRNYNLLDICEEWDLKKHRADCRA